jgi:hypothetical protein
MFQQLCDGTCNDIGYGYYKGIPEFNGEQHEYYQYKGYAIAKAGDIGEKNIKKMSVKRIEFQVCSSLCIGDYQYGPTTNKNKVGY